MKKTRRKIFNKQFSKISRQEGYALMFTVILVSIISLISIGLSNTTYKQMILSSGANDSELAFYESDVAMECALYLDNKTSVLTNNILSYTCGIDEKGNPYLMNISSVKVSKNLTKYNLNPSSSISNSTDSCFRIEIDKDNLSDTTTTTIKANGYNICDTSNRRAVERTIEVTY